MHDLQNYVLLTLSTLYICLGRGIGSQKELYMPDYTVYHNLSALELALVEIVQKNSNYMKLNRLYRSRQDRFQLILHITNFTGSRVAFATIPKLKVLLSYGEHAREFFPVESLLYFLRNLTQGLSAPPDSAAEHYSKQILSKVELFIIAMANPDGRHIIEQSGNYCWRGTALGVDLDRNFDWEFANKGSSADTTDEEYRGTRAFSEPECRAYIDLTKKYRFDVFVSFHSGVRQIFLPFSDSHSWKSNRKPYNMIQLLDLASKLSTATKYYFHYGNTYELNHYTADGTVYDYMAGITKIPFSYAIELWGTVYHQRDSCFDLFNPPNKNLQEALREVHPIYETLLLYLIRWKEQQIKNYMNPENDAPSLALGLFLLGAVVILTVLAAFHTKFPYVCRLYQRRRVISLRSLSSTFSVMNIMKS